MCSMTVRRRLDNGGATTALPSALRLQVSLYPRCGRKTLVFCLAPRQLLCGKHDFPCFSHIVTAKRRRPRFHIT
jgi:hypothetical protein